MKIGILTLPKAVNDGAILQAYCLYQLLRSLLPEAHIEIVDYQPKIIEKKERRRLIKRSFPFVNYPFWLKRRGLHQFLQHHTHMSPQALISDDLKTCQAFVARQNYDVVVVGSDVVWQVRDGQAIPLPPNIYHLPNMPHIKKIAFAASADRSDQTQWHHQAQQVQQYLNAFDFITVRDQTTQMYLDQVVRLAPPIHFMPDPTILWDFSAILDVPHHLKRPQQKLAGVAVSGVHARQRLTQQLMQAGYTVVNLLGGKVDGQISPPLSSLSQRIGIFAILDLIVADRFHSSIFTLKLGHAPAIFVEPSTKYPAGMVSKGRDLFQRLNMEEMVWRTDSARRVPDDLIATYLQKWSDLNLDMPAQFARLQQDAQQSLQALISMIK